MTTDPAPQGRPAGSVGGALVYAIGDVHGCYVQLRLLLGTIVRDAAGRAAGRRPALVFCGDYIDRGPASRAVVDALCWLQRHAPFDLHLLRGNHEQVLLDVLDDPEAARAWIDFGGATTLQSYGVRPPDPDGDSADLVRARDDLLEAMPAAHLRLLGSLELMVGIGDYVFVHAGVRPGVPLRAQSSKDLLWIRDDWIAHDRAAERIVVHGHSWTDSEPVVRAHRIGIDTGVYATGILTAVRIEDGQLGFLSTAAPPG